MGLPLQDESREKLKEHHRTLTAVICANSFSSLFVVLLLIYVGRTFPEPGRSAFLIYFVSIVVLGFSILSHWRLAGRRQRIRRDLVEGLVEEVLGPIEMIRSQGGYVLRVRDQKFVVDGFVGQNLPKGGNVRLAYAPHSRVVVSVDPC